MENAKRIQRDERSSLTEAIREGYWSWWALKGEVDRGRRVRSLSMVGTQDRGLEVLISGRLVGKKSEREKYRARLVRRGRGAWRALKPGGGFGTDVSAGEASEAHAIHLQHGFVKSRNLFGCQVHWYLSRLQKTTQAVTVGWRPGKLIFLTKASCFLDSSLPVCGQTETTPAMVGD